MSAAQISTIDENQAASIAIQSEHYPCAEQLYRKLLERDPDSPELLNNLGIALHFQGKTDEAIKVFRQALRLKEMPGTLALLSLDYCKAQEYEKAQSVLERTKRYYQDSNVLATVAPCYLETGEPIEGIHVYRELLRRGIPPGDENYMALGKVYLRALRHFADQLKESPGSEKYVQALKAAQTNPAAESDPTRKARSAVADAFREAPYVREGMSVEEMGNLLRDHRREPALLYLLAESCGEEAIRTFLSCERQFPRSLVVRRWHAEILASEGRSDSAIAEYGALIEESPRTLGIHTDLGAIYRRMGDWEKALEQFRQELALSPHDERALERVSECLVHLGRFEEERDFLKPLTTGNSPSKWVLLDLANVEEQLGDLQRAIADMQLLVKRDPKDPMAHYRLSHLYKKINQAHLAEKEAAEFRCLKGVGGAGDKCASEGGAKEGGQKAEPGPVSIGKPALPAQRH
jgi:tetratricopeptide (TPR) repeat protein